MTELVLFNQTEQFMIEEQINQRAKRKAEEEAATALFLQREAAAQRALEVQEEANQKAIQSILSEDNSDQAAQIQAFNAAGALKDASVMNDDNPLDCIVCFSLAEKDEHMRGWTCRVRKHFVCRDCWIKMENCPACGQSARRYL